MADKIDRQDPKTVNQLIAELRKYQKNGFGHALVRMHTKRWGSWPLEHHHLEQVSAPMVDDPEYPSAFILYLETAL